MTIKTPAFHAIGAIFDDQQHLAHQELTAYLHQVLLHIPTGSSLTLKDLEQDFDWGRNYLLSVYSRQYKAETFTAYRRELEKLFQYAWFIAGTSVLAMQRLQQIEAFVLFFRAPPVSWITIESYNRFIGAGDHRERNTLWKPFNYSFSKAEIRDIKARISKAATDQTDKLYLQEKKLLIKKNGYQVSDAAIKACATILRSFYKYLTLNEVVARNPWEGFKLGAVTHHNAGFSVGADRKFVVLRLSRKAIDLILDTLKQRFHTNWQLAEQSHTARALNPDLKKSKSKQQIESEKSARMYYAFALMFMLYLRVSELAVKGRAKDKAPGELSSGELAYKALNHHQPTMDLFIKYNDAWFLNILGKRGKWRLRSINPDVMQLIVEYRRFRGLKTDYPTQDESSVPIIPALRRGPTAQMAGHGHLSEKGISSNMLRKVIQEAFEIGLAEAEKLNDSELISELRICTSHWLRHTGISIEVDANRNLRHIMGESGHESFDSMKPYMDDDRLARYKTNTILKD